MIHVHRLLVDPSRDDLEDAIGAGLELLHRDRRHNHLPWSRREYERAWELCAGQPEGAEVWVNPMTYFASWADCLALRLTWWSDFLQRRHVLLHMVSHNEAVPFHQGTGVSPPPPLFELYPDSGFVQTEGRPLVVCACGAVGTVAEIAWMGIECGPCHDRRQAEELPSRPWDVVKLPPFHSPITRVRFVDRGSQSRLLFDFVGTSVSQELDLITMQHLEARFDGDELRAITPDGSLQLAYDLGIWRNEADGTPPRQVRQLYARGFEADRVAMSPSGRYAIFSLTSGGVCSLQIWDWADETSQPLVWGGPAVRVVFSPDESTLYLIDDTGRIQSSSPPLTGPRQSCRTNLSNLRTAELYPLPREHHLMARQAGTFRVVDVRSGQLVHEAYLGAFDNPGLRPFQSDTGRVLLGIEPHPGVWHFLRLPTLATLARLTLPGPPLSPLVANDTWFVLGDDRTLRLVPRPPLMEWAERIA